MQSISLWFFPSSPLVEVVWIGASTSVRNDTLEVSTNMPNNLSFAVDQAINLYNFPPR